jgi:hypothetical protein
MLGLQHEILDFPAGINARFPAAETASAVPDGKPSVAAVQIKAGHGLQDIFAEHACGMAQTRRDS